MLFSQFYILPIATFGKTLVRYHIPKFEVSSILSIRGHWYLPIQKNLKYLSFIPAFLPVKFDPSKYLFRMLENADQNNFEYGHLLRCGKVRTSSKLSQLTSGSSQHLSRQDSLFALVNLKKSRIAMNKFKSVISNNHVNISSSTTVGCSVRCRSPFFHFVSFISLSTFNICLSSSLFVKRKFYFAFLA